jgi:hypothetical protein
MTEESDFEIIDRRKANEEPPAAEPEQPGSQAQEGQGPAPHPEGQPGAQQLRLSDINGVLSLCISLLHEHAWQCLGLVTNPVTQQIQQDLEQARIAIDAVGALVELLRTRVSDGEQRELQALITDLRMNFVEQRNKQGG